jgi:multicomponent Na+:H+ antiporter subunit E
MRGRESVFYRKLLLAVILLVFWIVITASLAPVNLVLGAICSAFTAFLSLLVLGRTMDDSLTLPVMLRLPLFSLALGWEIIKANLDVAKIILDPHLPIDPRVTEYRTYLEGDLPRTFFANSITLTPGTVTLEVDNGVFYVHCLAPHHEEGLHDGGLERLVAWLFGVKRDEGSPAA